MLQELVGGVESCRFEIEDALDRQLGARPLPFPGMDSTYMPLDLALINALLFL